MVIDTSAIVAILLNEDEAPAIESAIAYKPVAQRIVATPTLVEMYVTMHRKE